MCHGASGIILYDIRTCGHCNVLYPSHSLADSLPPPSNVFLSDVNFGQLTFSWNSIMSAHCNDCQIQYDIIATNCGVCPLRTTNNSVICETDIIIIVGGQTKICTLLLRTVICGSVYGNISNPTSILVKDKLSDVTVID